MDKIRVTKTAQGRLYPPIEPFASAMVDVGDGHQIYVEQCGRPDGMPVVMLHGGPGGGCSDFMRRFFDPEIYRVILFDQRGCGRSKPLGSVENNTTWHLVRDIERLRIGLGIDAWAVFGGSWGSTLGLLYAQAYPDRVTHLILRGIFLFTQGELDWFYQGGAAQFYPDLWQDFLAPIPEAERGTLIEAYRKRLFGSDKNAEILAARAWSAWENALATVDARGAGMSGPDQFARVFARLENHYFSHKGWLTSPNQILGNMDKIRHIPGYIVQGRYDMICPPKAAYDLAQAWGDQVQLNLVPLSGHALSEPRVIEALVSICDHLADVQGRQ